MFFAGGEDIPGFKNLKEYDRKMIKNAIKNAAPVVKKLRMNSNDESEKKKNDELSNKVAEQSKLFDHYRKELNSLKNEELYKLFVENGQDIPSKRKDRIDRLADYMAFGVPKKCLQCKHGQIILDDFYYRCDGNIDAWTKCCYTTKEPDKEVIRIPETLKGYPMFKEFNSVITQRLFLNEPSSLADKPLDSHTSLNKKLQPLKNIQFYLYGKLKTPKKEVKRRIELMGGLVVGKLTYTTAAVITTKEKLGKKSTMIQNIKRMEIEVIEESYLDLIEPENGTVLDSLKLIKDNNIANWGSDPIKRVPQDIIEGKNVLKSGSMYRTSASKQKVKIMDGMEVDSRTGLEEKANIYKDTESTFSVVLSNSDSVVYSV
ncbi:unnamed protein product [Parnassius apollo]|uniref:NAD(+) ADP-ribosyltransferase n=1 Tax=Parnassius apollo TaxID=110799 RepID=A0A8S3WYN2_PARAO|nr:unnamed protein product [Parnassius apollo]